MKELGRERLRTGRANRVRFESSSFPARANMNFAFNEDTHTYIVNGMPVPGHTRVLDLGGLVPYAMIEADILERKAAIGREVHRTCALYDQGKSIMVIDPRVQGYVDAWIDFRKTSGFLPILCEHRDVYNFGGLLFGMQIDRIGRFPGVKKQAVIELKTCATVLPHHGVQLAAQAAGPKNYVGRTIDDILGMDYGTPLARFLSRDRFVCQLKPDGKWRLVPFTERSDLDTFLHALSITYWKTKHANVYKEANL